MLKIKFVKKVYKNYGWMGTYIQETNIIKIDRKLSLKDKIETIIHELGHYLIYKFKLGSEANYVYDIICIYLDKRYKGRRKTQFKWLTNYYF
jgi:Zn-dependent peptidase ImmA (M78 family)